MATRCGGIDAATVETVSAKASRILKTVDASASGFIYLLGNVQPTIQSGPQCGIVALQIAASCLRVTPLPTEEQILRTAKHMGISHFGEVLSAYWMAQLASSTLNCSAEVVDISKLDCREIVDLLLANGPLLIPYDSDKNFEPCLKGGSSAHWCVVVGLFIVELEVSDPIVYPKWITDDQIVKAKVAAFKNDQMQIFVVAMQGKSRHPGVWNLHALKDSNSNLFNLGRMGLTATKDKEFKWSNGGLADLRGKIVALKAFCESN
uniref:Actin maturation protease n=1 Tax=Trichuris muris TaxID=70415 RepID=A0A5S6R0C9_TRIMR